MFDVFSALTDSRAGGSAHLQSVATRAGWMVSDADLYDRWDSLNKECHRAAIHWVPVGDLSVMAMQTALSELALPNEDAIRISRTLLESMAEWPLWPDVTVAALAGLGATGLGLLSNIDDHLLAGAAVMRLGVFDPQLVVTSQRAQAYKPTPAFYHRATELLGPFVHVASGGQAAISGPAIPDPATLTRLSFRATARWAHLNAPPLGSESDLSCGQCALDSCRKDFLPCSSRMHVVILHQSWLVGQRLPDVEKQATDRRGRSVSRGIDRAHLVRHVSVAPGGAHGDDCGGRKRSMEPRNRCGSGVIDCFIVDTQIVATAREDDHIGVQVFCNGRLIGEPVAIVADRDEA